MFVAGCSSTHTALVSAVPAATQRGTEPGDLDVARLARMGGFGLMFYGPYQCAAQQSMPGTGGLPLKCTGRALQLSYRRRVAGSTGIARWIAFSPPGAYRTSSPRYPRQSELVPPLSTQRLPFPHLILHPAGAQVALNQTALAPVACPASHPASHP